MLINEIWDTGWINIISIDEKQKVISNSYFRENFRLVCYPFIFCRILVSKVDYKIYESRM